jgi:galactokinase
MEVFRMNTQELKKGFAAREHDALLTDIYVDADRIAYQSERYVKAIECYEKAFGEDDVAIYSAPGRSEVGGNHTDHQHGEVLAASINNDAIAIVKPLDEAVVKVISDGYDLITIDLNNLSLVEDEKGTTTSLIKGVLAGVKDHGFQIGGFQAYITSDVLIGAGLSSSAAFETIIGTILSGLYNDMKISAIEIAIIGQYAENVYFGKPCGLMDQMACSVGGMVHIDFADPANPVVEPVAFDIAKHGYSLCITDTKGSHADLTDDYAAIPVEMKQVAAFFGKDFLHEVSKEDLMKNLAAIREKTNDRAVLRALHFVEENERVKAEVAALKADDIAAFLATVNTSGNSSYKYLQNVYTNHDVEHQNVSIALCVSEMVLGENGVCRVHGGGFAGTIQAFVKDTAVADYQAQMNAIFGEGACSVLKIRKYGGMLVMK